MSQVKPKTKTQTINTSGVIPVMFGAFHVGEYRVPYLSTVMRCQQVAEYFSLVTEEPKYASQDWTITELYQRDIDKKRVLDIADNYLDPDRQEKPRFFNSLTVVLRKSEEKEPWQTPTGDTPYEVQLPMGPIRVSFDRHQGHEFPAPCTFGTVEWNRDQVYAVAIDGQHRLAALQHLWDHHKETAKQISVSVLLLIIDEEIGFCWPDDRDQLSMMRSIFIDLNKHAVPVSRARNLLLDDNAPEALFLRSLMGKSLSFEIAEEEGPLGLPLGRDGDFDRCIPLNLVDWHSEAKSKVDAGPYLTSVLALDWIVEKLLKSQGNLHQLLTLDKHSPDDEKYYTEIGRKLSRWKMAWRNGIREHLRECEKLQLPFALTTQELDAIAQEFEAIWARPITRILSSITPYRKLIEKRLEGNTLTPEFGQWFQAYSAYEGNKNREQRVLRYYEDRLSEITKYLRDRGVPVGEFRDHVTEVEDYIKQGSVFYLLVGQRAVIYALGELAGSNDIALLSDASGVSLDEFESCPNDFYAFYLQIAINEIYERAPELFNKGCKVKREDVEKADLVSEAFWAGSLVKRDDPRQVDFSQVGALRGSRWFVAMSHLYWFWNVNSDVIRKEEVLGAIDDPGQILEMPLGNYLNKAIADVRGRIGRQENESPMTFLISPLEGADDLLLDSVTRSRLRLLVDLLWDGG